MQNTAEPEANNVPARERLDSWKDIAAYLQREVRTVQLWEKNEGMPVHRHAHTKRGTVYAYTVELDAWWTGRRAILQLQNPPPKPRFPQWWIAVAAAAGLFIVGGALLLLMSGRSQLASAEAVILPLTSDPGSEMGASFSPDGNQVAFAWKRQGKQDFDIYVKVVGSSETLQLTKTPDSDVSPSWSPDGREIAFHRTGQNDACGIYAVSPLGGPERLITELSGAARRTPGCEVKCGCWSGNPKLSSAQLSWSPDANWLAHAGISLISIRTGEQRRLTAPPNGVSDAYPAFSPDGSLLAFVRPLSLGVHELYVVAVSGGEPKRLATQTQIIFGLGWTADGREIVYSSGRWTFGDAGLWRVPVSGGPARPVVEARERAWLPSIASRGGRLAFTRRSSDTNVWHVKIGDGEKPHPAARLIASTLTDAAPAYSPDGRRIAFTSDRSGTNQVWVCDWDGSNASQLTFFPTPGAVLGAWSPDGKQISFDSAVRGNVDIYIMPASGGAPRQLTAETAAESGASWSRDGRWVYFASDRTGRHEIWKIPTEGGTAVQVTKNGGNRPVESADGKFVYYEKGPSSVREFAAWRTPVDGGQEVPILDGPGSRWALVSDGLHYYQPENTLERSGPWLLVFFEFATARTRVVAPLPGLPLIGQRPAVSPDGRNVLYTQLDVNETDLMLVDGFR